MLGFVTGASSGVGEAFAARLAADGWDLHITARRGGRLRALARQLTDQHGVHVLAVARLARAALPAMIARGSGAIINVASLLAFSGSLPPQPLPHRAVYAAAKAFQVTFTQALAGELAGTGVQVQACCPGLIDTEFHTLAGFDLAAVPFPVMRPDEVAGAALAALRLGETVCVPGLDDPSMIDAVSQAQQALLLTAVSSPLAGRYRTEQRT